MRKRIAIGVAGSLVVAASLMAGISIAGSDSLPGEREAAAVVVAEPVTAVARGTQASTRGGGNQPTIDFLYAPNPTVPETEGGSLVQPVRCPARAGNPIGGGARTSQGIVVAYLSRAHPRTANRPKRTYFVGVEDVSDMNPVGSGAYIEVQCAKNMVVKP